MDDKFDSNLTALIDMLTEALGVEEDYTKGYMSLIPVAAATVNERFGTNIENESEVLLVGSGCFGDPEKALSRPTLQTQVYDLLSIHDSYFLMPMTKQTAHAIMQSCDCFCLKKEQCVNKNITPIREENDCVFISKAELMTAFSDWPMDDLILFANPVYTSMALLEYTEYAYKAADKHFNLRRKNVNDEWVDTD